MAYNIIGLSPGHNSSICLVSNGQIKYFIEEERLSRTKWDGFPILALLNAIKGYPINELVITGTYGAEGFPFIGENQEIVYSSILRKYFSFPNNLNDNPIKTTYLGDKHHLTHAASAFYNSGFDKAIAVIIDGAGSSNQLSFNFYGNTHKNLVFETESIFYCDYPSTFNKLFGVYGGNNFSPSLKDRPDIDVNEGVTITKAYEAVSEYLGFGFLENGKTMGLSSYGKPNLKIPQLFKNNKATKDIFVPHYPLGAFINIDSNPIFQRNRSPKEFHHDFSKVLEIEKDLAFKIQKETQEKAGDLVEKALKLSKLNKVVVAGGYGLNCVANYYLKKRFPNVEFYFEPVANDAGTSIGAALLKWHEYSQNTKPNKQTSIYLGPKYPLEETEKTIQSYSDKFYLHKKEPKNVAKLISERNIVTLYQGSSEAGPRALGNRSILYDPTDPEGKSFVNKVKKREWFRPFAGSILKEKANEWFDMAGLEESPFMMYAVDVKRDKQKNIQAITHVDGTCRIQTVTEEQNPYYYKLIQEFEKITGVPILFNTSFNLAGDPLVETIEDALKTMLRSEMKYMYVPELGYLLEKK